MMPGDEVSQNSAMHTELLHRVQCPSGGVIYAADAAFEMRVGIVTGYGFDAPLEFLGVLAEVMPQPGNVCPVGAAHCRCVPGGKLSHCAQMIFEIVDDKRSIPGLPHMRYGGILLVRLSTRCGWMAHADMRTVQLCA